MQGEEAGRLAHWMCVRGERGLTGGKGGSVCVKESTTDEVEHAVKDKGNAMQAQQLP
jgi:hypothetical protein